MRNFSRHIKHFSCLLQPEFRHHQHIRPFYLHFGKETVKAGTAAVDLRMQVAGEAVRAAGRGDVANVYRIAVDGKPVPTARTLVGQLVVFAAEHLAATLVVKQERDLFRPYGKGGELRDEAHAKRVAGTYFEARLDPWESIPVAPSFNFVLAHNRGAAFSFLADAGGWQRWLFGALAVAVVAGLLFMLWKHNGKRLFSLAASLICAGALGNLIDRAMHGYVIDFIDLYWRDWHWPAFNVADIAICVGCAFFIWDELRGVSRSR